jgi:hypothetical protein
MRRFAMLLLMVMSVFVLYGCNSNVTEDEARKIAVDYANKESNLKWEFSSIELVDNHWVVVQVNAVNHKEAMYIRINVDNGKVDSVKQTE